MHNPAPMDYDWVQLVPAFALLFPSRVAAALFGPWPAAVLPTHSTKLGVLHLRRMHDRSADKRSPSKGGAEVANCLSDSSQGHSRTLAHASRSCRDGLAPETGSDTSHER